MDLTRLSMDLTAAIEDSRSHAARQGEGYIRPRHLFAVLLTDKGALARAADSFGLKKDQAVAALQRLPEGEVSRLEPGRLPIAGRALRDLLDAAFHIADQRGGHVVGPFEVALAATNSDRFDVSGPLRDSGWTAEVLTQALDSTEFMDPGAVDPEGGGSLLERFAQDLTSAARAGELPPVIGRDEETRAMVQTLLRKSKNNPVLVGDPGTGKTAVVEGLAQRIASGDVPDSLKDSRLMALDLTALVAGAKYRGEFEERIKGVVDEVSGRDDIILFLDEIHTLVGTGGSAGGMDAANILKPALARGKLRCIGATTHEEYRESIEKDAALARRFDKVVVEEPDDEMTLAMLRGARGHYERHHGVGIREDALLATVKLGRRHLRDRYFPDKAFDILDEASAKIRLQMESKPDPIDALEREVVRMSGQRDRLAEEGAEELKQVEDHLQERRAELESLLNRWTQERDARGRLGETKTAIEEQQRALTSAEAAGDVAAAAEIQYGTLKYLEEQLEDVEHKLKKLLEAGPLVPPDVGPQEVAAAVARRARVPVSRMMENERERLLQLEDRLASRVRGQTGAVEAVSEAARRMRADLRAKRKPASFLFVGPTGVGKTELAKALADALFDDESALVRIDMAEYKESHSVSGLIGSRPGLVGSEQGGFLTEQVRRAPHSVVLFDEIEKGHPEVIDILLGVLDEGRLTDAQGRFCDFSNTIVLLTSNLGVREANEATEDPDERRDIIMEVVQRSLRPELFNRLNGVIPFNSLDMDVLQLIVRSHLEAVSRQLSEQHESELVADDGAVLFLATQAYDPAYGARPVERTVDRLVLADLSRLILSGSVQPGSRVQLTTEGDDLSILVGTPEELDAMEAVA